MKKARLLALLVLVSLLLVGCMDQSGDEQAAVATLVEAFGEKLQAVSLLAPKEIVSQSIREHYGPLVTPELLARWVSDPQTAPGRVTSSPWPDRIDIRSIDRTARGIYRVQGDIIEVTSVEVKTGGVAAKRPITLVVEQVGDRWLISSVTLGAYE